MKVLNFRKAQKKDFDKLVALQFEAWNYHHRNDSLWSNSQGQSRAIRAVVKDSFFQKHKNYLAIVLTCDKDVVGYATAEIKNKGSAYSEKKIGHIGTVFIDSKHRKLGLGKMAIDYFFKVFKKNNVKTITLNVDVKNKAGVSAWKRMGFKDWRLELRMKLK